MLFRANLVANWHLRFFSFTGRVMTSKLGFLSSRSVIFITNATEISLGPTASRIRWTALLLVIPPRQMPYWFTIQGQNGTTSQTHIAWIHIDFHLRFILPSSMTGVSFALCFGTRVYQLENPFLRAPVSSDWIHPLTCFSRAR
jgi:hypothetical protein